MSALLLALLAFPAWAHGPIPQRAAALTEQLHHHDDPDLLARRGALRVQEGDVDGAIADFEHARAIAPDRAGIDEQLADALLRSGRPERAVAVLDDLLARDPTSSWAHYLRAKALLATGTRAEAVAAFTQAIDRSGAPGPGVYLDRAGAIDDPHERLASLEEGVARLGPVASLLEPGIDLHRSLGDHDGALAWIARLPAPLPTTPRWLARRGEVLAAAGREREAIEVWEQALAAIARLPPSRRDTAPHRTLRADVERSLAAHRPPRPPALIGYGLAAGLLGCVALLALRSGRTLGGRYNDSR